MRRNRCGTYGLVGAAVVAASLAVAPAAGATASPATGAAAHAAVAGKKKPTVVPVRVHVSPDEGTYGVGQLVTARFSHEIARKDDVERAISVTVNKTEAVGAWGWIDDRTAIYRPKRFWPGKAKVKFRFQLHRVVVRKAGNTKYIGGRRANKNYVLRTARSFVMTIKNSTHRMYVDRNGRRVRTFKVSLGKSGYRTRSGIKILTGEKYQSLRMTGVDRFTGEAWDVISPYSIRLTPTGEFLHGAPWAYHRLGLANGSHGCTNMYVSDARWLYHQVIAGDPVVTRGTGRKMEVWNGTPGSYWNYNWGTWKRMSGKNIIKRYPAIAQAAAAAVAGP